MNDKSNLSNLSLSKDQLVIDDGDPITPPDEENDKYFDQPPDMITQISIDSMSFYILNPLGKEKFSSDLECLIRKALEELSLIRQETKLPTEEQQTKFCGRVQTLQQHLVDMSESFALLSTEFDKVTLHQLKSLDFNRRESMIPGFIEKGIGIKDQTINTTIYHEAKSRIDEDLKNQLSEITTVIKDLENKQENLIDQKPDPLEKKKIKN